MRANYNGGRKKTGKAELCGPASLCDVEPHARSGRSVGAARPFGLLITRSAPMVSHESGGVTRPRSLFNVALLRRGSCPGRTRTQPAVGIAAQSTLSTPPHGIAAEPPDRGTSRLQIPSAFSRPWQWTTLGLPCPVSFPTVSQRRRISPPAPSTTGHLTTGAYMSKNEVHSERGAFPHYPPGDKRLSAVPKQRWGRLPQHAVVVDPQEFLRGTLRFLCR